MDFTVVLLTKNRKEIQKSIQSVLNILDYNIHLNLVIIDGNENDNVNYLVSKNFFEYKNHITIIKQRNIGFMNGCFESISHIRTKFFTFMYDDDELSPYYGELVRKALISNKIFYSYGKVSSFSSTFKFLKPSLNYEPANQILSNYFRLNFGKRLIPPNSPICSIFKTEILKDWKKILLDYCQKDKHFYFYLLEKNIGPDLLLYLLSLHNEENNKIIHSKSYIAKFSSHKNSMSIMYGNLQLGIGYLYARIIFFDRYKQTIDNLKRIKFKCYIIIKILFTILRGNVYLNKFKKKTINHFFSLYKSKI